MDTCVDVVQVGGFVYDVDWIRSFRGSASDERFLMAGIFRVEGKVKVVRRGGRRWVLFFKKELDVE